MFDACTAKDVGKAGKSGKKKYQNLSEKIKRLAQSGIITAIDREQWLSIAKERNHKLHDAMWNLDEFQQSDVEKVVAAARRATNIRKIQKRSLAN